ncbi:hypothetical protein FOMPIDRAFT_160388 [Fomitopsis schrenkii]|uniref:Uncharacterized protein n=1 Tax=Fomitopsis schrenkii TaxID=2126942 RepID=S8EGE1_FOMSC|nr:hypothetical protein FOMPIDRAFT_160388 [Fomitopsis schrenkii]
MMGDRLARPLPKRRKLASAQVGRKSSSTSTFGLTVQHLDTLTHGTALCTSCHRNFAQRLNEVVRCARCRATTCLVCSRTCSAPPLSLPPTPALTRSSTPSPYPSPRRPALALSTNSRIPNGMVNALPSTRGHAATGKRRKPLLLNSDEGCSSDDEKAGKDTSQHGCGRTVCRKCCHENPLSATTICYDCLNQPYNPPTQQFDARGSH